MARSAFVVDVVFDNLATLAEQLKAQGRVREFKSLCSKWGMDDVLLSQRSKHSHRLSEALAG